MQETAFILCWFRVFPINCLQTSLSFLHPSFDVLNKHLSQKTSGRNQGDQNFWKSRYFVHLWLFSPILLPLSTASRAVPLMCHCQCASQPWIPEMLISPWKCPNPTSHPSQKGTFKPLLQILLAPLLDFSLKDVKRNLNQDSGFRQQLFEQREREIAWKIFLTLRSLPLLSELYSCDSKCH